MNIKYGRGDKVLQAIIIFFLVTILAICIYPLIYVISMAISDPLQIAARPVLLFPRGFSMLAMQTLFEGGTIWRYYWNTIFYTTVGTAINIFMTVIIAYPLSRKDFAARKPITLFVTFTMLFGALR